MGEASHTSASAPPQQQAQRAQRAVEAPQVAADLGNMAIAQYVRGGGAAGSFAGAPVDNQQSNQVRRQELARAPIAGTTGTPAPRSVPQPVKAALAGGEGAPLPDAERWSSRIGSDMSGARVVSGSTAAAAASAVGARAFTVGNRVFMGAGNDAATDGGELLAHELAHVAQQQGAAPPGSWDQLPILDHDHPHELAARGGQGAAHGFGELAIARDPERELLYADYREKYAEKIGDGIDAFIHGAQLAVGSPFITVPGSPPLPNLILGGLTGEALNAKLDVFLSKAKVETAVEHARVHGREVLKRHDKDPGTLVDTNTGPNRWFPEVALDLGALLIEAMRVSLARMVPRYIDAAVALAAAEEAKNQSTDMATAPRVSAGDVVASSPLDELVVDNALVPATFDYFHFRSANPDAKGALGELHQVAIAWEAPRAGTFWARATRMDDPKLPATAEDVAYALFGTAAKSGRLVIVSPPLFGFGGGKDLLPEWREQLEEMGVTDFNVEGDVEEVAKADGPLHEEMAQRQGAEFPTKALTKLDVLRLIDDSMQILGSIDAAGAAYGMGKDPTMPGTAAVRTKLVERHAQIAAGSEADASGWAGHAQGQRDVLVQAAFAMQVHAKRIADLTKFETDAAAKAGGFNLPAFARTALRRVAAEFASAVGMSDLPAIAAQLLAQAETDAGQLPIELADGMLAAIQRQIDDAREDKRKEHDDQDAYGGGHDTYDVDGLRERQLQLKLRLARIRELLQSNPAAATKELAAIQHDMSELGHESQMVAEMDQIDATWQAIVSAISVFTTESTDRRLNSLKREGEALHRTWKFFYDGYRSGKADNKKILDDLQKLRTDGRLSRWLGAVRATVTDAQTQAMVGKFAAMIVITIVTDGLGDIVLAGAEGWGLAAGTARLVAGGAEAIAFTTLSQIFLDDDHGFGHIAFDLGANLVMFGAMRRFALFAETAKLSKGVATTGQTVLMAGLTLARAELEKAITDGRVLDRGEITELAVQGIIQAIAMHAIAPTVKEKLFGGLEGSAYEFMSNLRANNATWESLKLDANALKSAKDLAKAQAYIAKERAWIQERLAVLDEIARNAASDPSLQKRLKLDPSQIREMRAPLVEALGTLDDPTLMANLAPKGPGMFSCPAESFDAVIHAMKGEIVGTTSTDGARTVDVKLPDGKVVKVTEVIDGATEWVAGLREKLTPEQLAELDQLGRGLSPRMLYALLGGEVESARQTLDLARLRNAEHAAPGVQDKVPLPQDVTPEAWAELQALIREHGLHEGLQRWHDVQGEEINATIVPGSEFTGTGRGVAEPEKVAAKGRACLPYLESLFKGRVASIDGAGGEVVVKLRDGKTLKIAIMATDLPYVQVARTKVNTQRGEHTIQLSSKIADDQIPRAVAHELGEIIAATMEAGDPKRRDPRNRLGTSDVDTRGDGQLSPHDWGRAAELNLLAAQLERPTLTPGERTKIRRELTALVDELGLRAGSDGAAARRQALVTEGALSPEALGQLYDPQAGLTGSAEHLAPEDRALFDELQSSPEKQGDLDKLQEFRDRRKNKLEPLAVAPADLDADGRIKPEAMDRMAREAAMARAQKSAEMLAWLYQLNAEPRSAGDKYATLDLPVWIGGGAATAGLTKETLFIDARGRWQLDSNKRLAQTAGQLSGLRDAGMGDPSSFAAPDERVPLQAIRAFEDNLARQARVVNGVASISMESGRQVLTITPVAGPEVKFYLGGGSRVTFAPGFPRESLPGQRMAFSDALRVVREELAPKGIDVDKLVGEYGRLTDADAIEVRRRLRRFEGYITSPEGKAALDVLGAAGDWAKARAHAPDKIMRGDEANAATNFRTSGVRDWVISGQGGTAISAAENILRQTEGMNPPVKVRMMGRDTPAGLEWNTQWKQVFAKYGPAGEGRLSVEVVTNINTMVVAPDGSVSGVNVVDATGTSRLVTGDGYIQSMGRFNTLPDPIAGYVSKVYNEQHGATPVAGSRVEGQLLWSRESGQYLGYRVKVTQGGKTSTFDVTGARSRFLPPELFPNRSTRELVQPERGSTKKAEDTAQGRDAPENSGTFAGGLEASATQASEYGMSMSDNKVRVMDADGHDVTP